MARINFFLQEDGELVVNEVNTLPGFAKVSMYSKLWAESGLSYAGLIEKLIQLAIDRHQQDQSLKNTVN